ncbi:MAG: hypothetical protein V4556_13790 [Bacteroidota bacterium]
MKNNFYKILLVTLVSASLFSSCNGSREMRRNGVNNNGYRGYR